MKFRVKVGKSFELEMNIPGSKDKGRSLSLKWVVVLLTVAVVLGAVFAASAYGALTGDYSSLKAIVDAGMDAVTILVQRAPTSGK